jgi:mRNA interferase MazF
MENSDSKKQLLDNWNKEKYLTHSRKEYPSIKAGQIWWCRMGENIGTEINGKHKTFTRPVYILKKLNQKSALIIPLTSQKKKGTWYFSFLYNQRMECAAFSQIRTISTLRLESLLGTLEKELRNKIQNQLLTFLR